ncbi:MAG: HAMP domain-containing histidine kinase, partial [Anaerolineae bacterium]|nr:HAMP domain-containing histidine kinase [Anaerolineae bacterium]
GMVQDITERKQAEQQVLELALERERNSILKEFISRVSHDLKNPLSVIYTSLDLLQRVQTEAQRDEKIRQIRSQANRLNKLIQDSLTIHRLDYVPTLTLKPVRINSLLMELKQELHPIIERKQIHMEMALSMGLAPVNANEEEIRRALENLFENALNYTPDQGTITIRTASRDAYTVVEFTDTGIGITPEEKAVIFERFQRGDTAKRMVESGSGLGLAIVHRIVMMHQGQIDVESEVGKGSTFRMILPTGDEP